MTDKKELAGKVAIIGGASKGLGFGCAEALAMCRANLVITGRNEESLISAAAKLEKHGVQVLCLVGDMADADFNTKIIDETIKKFERLDILINNSGGPPAGKFEAFAEADWEKAFQSVLMYNIRMTSKAVVEMKKNNWGRIINITSLSVKEPAETLVLSNVYRAGVVAFAKSISKQLIKSNITVNNLCPGAFMTNRAVELINLAAKAANKTAEEIENENKQKLPLGRYQTPEELGSITAFLCSEGAAGITGTTLQIDGGISNSLF